MPRWPARQWFIIALGAALGAAWLAPEVGHRGGPAHPAGIHHWLIATIFLISGLTLRTTDLRAAIGRVRLHLFIQGFSLLLIPLLALALDPLLERAGLPAALRSGVLILVCLPTTVTSGVMFTRSSAGNHAAALCNATLGNLLGIVIVPLSILVVTGRHGEVDGWAVARQLGIIVLLPFAIGQALHSPWAARIAPWAERIASRSSHLGIVAQSCLLVLIYHVFCDSIASAHDGPSPATVALTMALMAGLHGALLALALALSGWRPWGFDRADRVAAVITSTQKTIALGLPIIAIIFAGDPALPALTLPLIIYHLLQLVTAAALAPAWRSWVGREVRPGAA